MRPLTVIALALLLLPLLATLSCAPPPAEPAVVLVILDTTRADHLSAYGYERETTPNLKRLADEGERYDNAWSQAPWTLPAVATILTGQPPHRHGAGRGQRGMYGVAPEVTTVAERFQRAGWKTAAFISVLWCNPRLSNLNRGFDLYDFASSDESNVGQRTAEETNRAAMRFIDEAKDDSFFLTVHYFDPHLTYDPPAPYDTMFEPDDSADRLGENFGSAAEIFAIRDGRRPVVGRERQSLIARYDGELRYMDDRFGELREALERAGRWENSLVVVVADHGEEFWDHGGFEHGHSHYREMLRVPLIVKRPGGEPQQIADRVRQLDIAPTLTDFAAIDSEGLPGRPLGSGPARYAIAEGSLWGGDLVSIRSDDGLLIVDRATGSTRFYTADDAQERNALDHGPADLHQLLRALPLTIDRSVAPEALTDEQREQLRSLGYVE